jgi:AcrR family transcriptional regulator
MSVSAAVGRPRDPEVDERITRAAAEVFGAEGWARFSVDAVARRAGVGKASIYLRWPNKEALLVAVFASRLSGVRDIDTGSLRDDLVALARQVLHAFLGESGGAVLRLVVKEPRAGGIEIRSKARDVITLVVAAALVFGAFFLVRTCAPGDTVFGGARAASCPGPP